MTQKKEGSSAPGSEGECTQSMVLTEFSGAPGTAGDELDLAATLAGKAQESLDRQRIRDPFGEPLSAA